jgi:hypothetical protein
MVPLLSGEREGARKVVGVPQIFVVELNRVPAGAEADDEGAYTLWPTPVLFPPVIDLGSIFGCRRPRSAR